MTDAKTTPALHVSGLQLLEAWARLDPGRRSYEVRRGTEGNWFVRVSSTRWGAAKRAEAGIPYVHENLYTAADAAINER
jgi:hypothetical protein